jgi:hypothetical protein
MLTYAAPPSGVNVRICRCETMVYVLTRMSVAGSRSPPRLVAVSRGG